jgi:hypothetical protein
MLPELLSSASPIVADSGAWLDEDVDKLSLVLLLQNCSDHTRLRYVHVLQLDDIVAVSP